MQTVPDELKDDKEAINAIAIAWDEAVKKHGKADVTTVLDCSPPPSPKMKSVS